MYAVWYNWRTKTKENFSFRCSGERIKLACVNWYGFHLEDLVVNGLDRDAIHYFFPQDDFSNSNHEFVAFFDEISF